MTVPPDDPYAPPATDAVATPDPATRYTEPAGRLARVAAHVVDWFVIWVIAVIAISIYFAVRDAGSMRLPGDELRVYLGLWPGLFLQMLMQAAVGQSLGKRLFGLRVVTEDGRPASVWRVVVQRNLLPGILMGVCGIIWILDVFSITRPDGRTFHDRMAATRVVRARPGPTATST